MLTSYSGTLVFLVYAKHMDPIHSFVCFQILIEISTIYLSCIKKDSIFIQISLKAQKIYSQGMEGFLFLC